MQVHKSFLSHVSSQNVPRRQNWYNSLLLDSQTRIKWEEEGGRGALLPLPPPGQDTVGII